MRALRGAFFVGLAAVAGIAACDEFSSSDPPGGGSLDASTADTSAPSPDAAGGDGGGADAGPRCGAPASSGVFICDDFSNPDSGVWTPVVTNGAATIDNGSLLTTIQNDTSNGAIAVYTRAFELGTPWTTVRVQAKVLSFGATLLDAGAPEGGAGQPEGGTDNRADIATLLQVVDEREYGVVLAAGGPAPHRLYVFAESKDRSVTGTYSSGPILEPGARVTLLLKYGASPLQISVFVDDKLVSLTPAASSTFPVLPSASRVATYFGVFTEQKHFKASARLDDVEIETRP